MLGALRQAFEPHRFHPRASRSIARSAKARQTKSGWRQPAGKVCVITTTTLSLGMRFAVANTVVGGRLTDGGVVTTKGGPEGSGRIEAATLYPRRCGQQTGGELALTKAIGAATTPHRRRQGKTHANR